MKPSAHPMILPIAKGPLSGAMRVPGDKSIGHRSLLFGALCDGTVRVTGLGAGGDNKSTARILKQLGVVIEAAPDDAGVVLVHGVGLDGLRAPAEPLDCGNSGTTMRLVLGILAGQDFEATLIGDESLSRRPMRRVLDPLQRMGLEVLDARDGTFPPLRVRGRKPTVAMAYDSPIASAQVKSAIMLAGLWAEGDTIVREPGRSRDHTERMMAWLGRPPSARVLHVPGDLSSAAFMLAAALIVPGSSVTITGVGVNPTRTGFLDALIAMGAQVRRSNEATDNGEPRADLTVTYAPLQGVTIDGDLALRSLDELPLLATLAAVADGSTHIRDAGELRVKESDRITRTAEFLRSFGVPVDEHPDGLTVHGDPGRGLKAGRIDADGDHRIAMSGALLALRAASGSQLVGAEAIATSFPSFWSDLQNLGVPTF